MYKYINTNKDKMETDTFVKLSFQSSFERKNIQIRM